MILIYKYETILWSTIMNTERILITDTNGLVLKTVFLNESLTSDSGHAVPGQPGNPERAQAVIFGGIISEPKPQPPCSWLSKLQFRSHCTL
jgi:hypothetical protein